MRSPREKFGMYPTGLAAGVVLVLSIIMLSRNKQAEPVSIAIAETQIVDAATQPAAVDVPKPIVNSIGMTFLRVNPGEFVMGSPADEVGRDTDETQHKVRITRPFYLGAYQVTQKQYREVMGDNPSYYKGGDFPAEQRGDLPVDSVSWFQAMEFCKKLGAKEGRTYRLPTEAEREYACRAGSTGPYYGGSKLDDIGWYLSNSDDMTHPVGMLQPNAWGFYDMQGNLWEWCLDWYGEYPPGDAVDPTGPPTGTMRVLRGGAIGYDLEHARAAFRNSYTPDSQVYHNGFRVVLDVR